MARAERARERERARETELGPAVNLVRCEVIVWDEVGLGFLS